MWPPHCGRKQDAAGRALADFGGGRNEQKRLIQVKRRSVFSNEVIVCWRFSSSKAVLLTCSASPRAAGLAKHKIALMTASGVNRAIYPGYLTAADVFVCVTCRVAGNHRCAMRTKGRADGLCMKLHKPSAHSCDRSSFIAHLCLLPLVSVLHLNEENTDRLSSPAVVISSLSELCWLFKTEGAPLCSDCHFFCNTLDHNDQSGNDNWRAVVPQQHTVNTWAQKSSLKPNVV